MNQPDEPLVQCPNCGETQIDLDGFGVQHCPACGYCQHPMLTGGVCQLCHAPVEDAP